LIGRFQLILFPSKLDRLALVLDCSFSQSAGKDRILVASRQLSRMAGQLFIVDRITNLDHAVILLHCSIATRYGVHADREASRVRAFDWRGML